MIYTINNCIRAFGYTDFNKLVEDKGSIDGLKEYVRANGYADIAVAEDTELLLVDVNGKTWHTGCYGAKLEPGPGPEPEPERDYLCFTSTGDSTVAMSQEGTQDTSDNKVIQYKLNNGQWQTWDLSDVTLHDGDKMYVKSDDEIPIAKIINYVIVYKKFVMTGSIAASGNVMSLLNFSDTLSDNAFYGLFQGCTSLTQAPELPVTTLAPWCYSHMFEGCTALVTTPELQATTLADNCYGWMFYGCTSLTATTALPATTLAGSCYAGMFKDCTSLTSAPELPATTLAYSCYYSMFEGCTALTAAPELHVTTLEQECYYSMFEGCTALTAAPSLPATTLAGSCYASMFNGCTALTTAPELPATSLASSCYAYMFLGCTALTTAPSLPATTLQQQCYYNMFGGCGSLTAAPELPATTLAYGCYGWMFFGCSQLNYVKAMCTDISAQDCLESWLSRVSDTGTFVKNSAATWTNTDAGIPTGWTVQIEGGVTPEPEPERDYLCFTSTGDSTVEMIQNGTPNASANKVIQYKLNDGQWQTWDLSAVTLADGDKMYLKSDDEIPVSEAYDIYKNFVITGSIAASGNIMSLLNFSDTLTDYAFCKMFDNCSQLTQPPTLPVTVLAQFCYTNMFKGCTALTTAPALPATTLADNCYFTMFSGCDSLTQAPELPATTLQFRCYGQMFMNCKGLVQAPALPATTLARSCYSYMFNSCTSLTTAPELPATVLESGCYSLMFNNCSKLNYVKALFTTDPTTYSYLLNWLSGVSSTGTFVKNSAATWTNEQAGIPTGWTVQTASPDK